VPSCSRDFSAAICFASILLAGGPAIRARALDSNVTSSQANLWQTRSWQTDEGLPDNEVTGVVQTRDGHLWVATLGGLMRFDGERFEAFSTTHLRKVPNRVVLTMYQDRGGQLWLVMDRGVVIRVHDTAARVFDGADGFTYLRGTTAAEDSEGGVWFICGNDVCRIKGDRVERFGAKEGFPAGENISLAADAKGQLWFASGMAVGIFKAGRWQKLVTAESGPVRMTAARSGGMWMCAGNRVTREVEGCEPREIVRLPERAAAQVMLEDHTGALWIGTAANGLLRVNGNEVESVAVSHPEITALTEDREGNLWVGTAGGLNQLRPRAMDLIGRKAGLSLESARSVCEDSRGLIWVVLQNGSLARGRGGQWHALTSADGWPDGDATCVAPARDGGVWIGTHDNGLRRWRGGRIQSWGPAEGLGGQFVRSLRQATNGDLWIATDAPSRMWLLRDGKIFEAHLPGRALAIRAMAEGADGTMWAGTADGQILRMQSGAIVNELGAQKGPPYSVRCLETTADGSLWIGYAGWGIGRWHDGRYARIGTAQGLYDDYVSQILSDGQGGLWVTGNHGLFKVRLEDMVDVAQGRKTHVRSTAYGRGEGLPSLQPAYDNSPSAWRGTDGRLWFSTRNGVLTVQPDRIRDNPVPPAVFVQELKVDDHPVALFESQSPLRKPEESKFRDLRALGEPLHLPPRHAKIEFAFGALSFNSPENVQFRYRLKGFDTDWTEAGTQRKAKYPRLPAGPYEFEVTACNEAGVWSRAGFQVPFAVQPFYWQTWWFRIGAVTAFTTVLIGLVRYVSFRRLRAHVARLEQAEALHRERARIARDMHDEVGAKLSRLSLLSEMASQQSEMPASARSEVAEISETARDTIRSFEEIVWAVNPKNDSLPQLMNYICRFAEDFFEGSGIECVFDVPETIPDIELPTDARHHLFLAAKEALNNIFKHAGARQVRVRLTLNADGFEIVIADDGRGFNAATLHPRAGSGNGLDNMRNRMNSAGGEMHLESRPGVGTRVSFQLHCAERRPAEQLSTLHPTVG
jgi:signal transduction histidine kinase/ligand-binding sensor domain-containing protein